MPTTSSPASSHKETCTILFVDDEPQACKWFVRLFSDAFTILTASSADEAEATLRQRADEIAVLVTDFRMPGRDGLSLLRAAQTNHRHVVRLMATAYAEKDVAVAAINQGRVQQILEKPFDEAVVREALRQAIDTYREREHEHSLAESRAAAMRETLGFLAHELNTPLATVLGYMGALKERHQPASTDTSHGLAQFAERRAGGTIAMIEAAERRTLYAMSLVATFVQSARDAYPDAVPAPLPASHLVNALLREYPFEGDERAWVTSDVAADFMLPEQRDLLYLVLSTLTKNALLALRGQLATEAFASLDPDAPPAALPSLHIALACGEQVAGKPQHYEIRFIDNGPGIAPDILARLMLEPVTTRASQGGSGMGLLFCRRVVESMGGLIEIRSELGQGTTVTLQFKFEANLERAQA
jgi:two-component system, response regulator PhcR